MQKRGRPLAFANDSRNSDILVGTFIYQSGMPAAFEFSQRMDHLPSSKGGSQYASTPVQVYEGQLAHLPSSPRNMSLKQFTAPRRPEASERSLAGGRPGGITTSRREPDAFKALEKSLREMSQLVPTAPVPAQGSGMSAARQGANLGSALSGAMPAQQNAQVSRSSNLIQRTSK